MSDATYESPFSTRYASPEMSHLFSQRRRILLYRKLWLALAIEQQQLGLPITDSQIQEMERHLEEISFDAALAYEKRFRHDVMAHIHAFGDQCPGAKAILHLGATSAFVTDNADLIQMKEGIFLLLQKLLLALQELASFAKAHAHEPCLGYTHYQPAQPTTVGKRACLWLQDFLFDAKEWARLHRELPFLGAKGATGTQASFLALFDGDEEKVKRLDTGLAGRFGFEALLTISGQTYTRKIDLLVLNAFASFAASVHKFGTDLRLLAHDREICESFGEGQVGSSAMPYKRNPIYAERLCGLSRFVLSLQQNAAATLSTQWLERSLDDSSNRRLVLPESFLAVDSILNILIPLIRGLRVDAASTKKHLDEALPHLVMENILMAAVKGGKNRQELHEKLRALSQQQELTAEKIAADPAFGLSLKEVKNHTSLKQLLGRAERQTLEFLDRELHSFLQQHPTQSISLPPLEI